MHVQHKKTAGLFLGTLSAVLKATRAVVGEGLSSLDFLRFTREAVPIAAGTASLVNGAI